MLVASSPGKSMPIYVVRWPREEVSLVRARNEAHLCDILDEIGDPGCARWAVYNGPLWIDLDLPMLPWKGDGQDDQVDVEAVVDGIGSEGDVPYRARPGGGETSYAMTQAVTEWALPHLHEVVEEWVGVDRDQAREPAYWMEKVTTALAKERADMDQLRRERAADLARTLPAETRQLMQAMGLSIEPTWVTSPSSAVQQPSRSSSMLVRGRVRERRVPADEILDDE